MDTSEKIYLLEAAKENLQACIELLEEAAGDDPHTERYLLNPLKIHLSEDHGFLARELSIGDLIHQELHGEDI